MTNNIMRNIAAILTCQLLLHSVVADEAPTAPVAHAHAHNDYLHQRPLLDALDYGFNSVEADIFLIRGELWVAHRWYNLDSKRTLKSLYLDPLLARVKQNQGRVYANGPAFTLLIDIKTNGQKTYTVLARLLKSYAEMLTTVSNGQMKLGAVTVIVSGNRAKQFIQSQVISYAGYDGRLSDLHSVLSAFHMPMISDNWRKHFDWNGIGIMPEEEKLKLRGIVKTAHAHGRVLRFWATPEQPALWRELKAAKVDLINTDELAALSAFLSE